MRRLSYAAAPAVLLVALGGPAAPPRPAGRLMAQAPPAPPGPVTPAYLKLPAARAAKPGRYFCLAADTEGWPRSGKVSPTFTPHDAVDGPDGNAEFGGQVLAGSGPRRGRVPSAHPGSATPANFGHLAFCQDGVREPLAAGLSRLPDHVCNVVGAAAQSQVVGANTQAVVAGVHYDNALRDGAVRECVSDTVWSIRLPRDREMPVAFTPRSADPKPAAIGTLDSPPESLLPGLGRPVKLTSSRHNPAVAATVSPAAAADDVRLDGEANTADKADSCDSPGRPGHVLFSLVATAFYVEADTKQAPPNGKKADAPTLTLPATVTAKPNRYFCIRATTNCASVKWVVPAGLDRLDPEIPVKDPNVLVVIGDAGTYTVQAYGALGDVATDLATCVVTVGTPPPPTPPTPPGPVDPLTQALRSAYAAETSATKAADAAAWAAVFAAAVTHVDLAAVATAGDLLADLKAAMAATRPDALPLVKAALAAEMAKAWGTQAAAPLDKAAAKAELTKIAQALSTLK